MDKPDATSSAMPDADGARPRRPPRSALVATAVAIAVVAAFVLSRRGDDEPEPLTRAQVAATVSSVVGKALDEAAAQPPQSVAVYQTIIPSLVFIRTDEGGRVVQEPEPGVPDPAVPDTGVPVPIVPDTALPEAESGAAEEEVLVGVGTGVIISDEGTILTANHVIDGASGIEVIFADGTKANGLVVSQEPERDIAVLRTDRLPEVLVPAVMGGGVQVGDAAYAVGHPLGLVGSFSSGVISGLDREIPVENGRTLDGLIQFDAAVNPGSSGGPLLNRAGQVVGIVTALANPTKQSTFAGIAFAVPIGAAAGGAGGGPPQ